MTYLIDAWLERSNPCLRIIETATGKVCATLDEACLQEMREQGELCLDDLLCNEPQKLKELIRKLFLYCHARTLRPIPSTCSETLI